MRVLQRRPANAVELWEENRYRRVLRTPEGLALIEVENRGTIDAPELCYRLCHGDVSAAMVTRLAPTLHKVLGLNVDPEPIQQLAHADRTLSPTASALRGMRPPRFAGWFETFANVIPFQQVSLDAGIAVVKRLVECFGASLEHQGHQFYAFPTAQAIGEAHPERLQECGLSLRKAKTLCTIAQAIESGELAEDKISSMSTQDARRALVAVSGIGPWSAGVVLLRGLGRLDVFPPGDVGASRGVSALLELPPEASLTRVIEGFGDQRGYLYFHALGRSLIDRGYIHPAPAAP